MNVETLIANIRIDLLEARKERNVVKSQVLLSLMNAIDNGSAVAIPHDTTATEVARRELSIDDVMKIIKNEINEMQDASAIYKERNTEKAAELDVKIAILKDYCESV